jgi:transcriptional regulator with XRE-family HTH domain
MPSTQRVARQTGSALRRIRLDRGIELYFVAMLTALTPQLLSAYEEGQQLPSDATLALLLAALECSPDEFARYYGPWGNIRLHIVLKV